MVHVLIVTFFRTTNFTKGALARMRERVLPILSQHVP
jgi:hypothetical protein